MATQTTTLRRVHVAGPPEKEPTTDTKAGWRYVQRCLRCDERLDTDGVWWKLGCELYELSDSRITSELAPNIECEDEDNVVCRSGD